MRWRQRSPDYEIIRLQLSQLFAQDLRGDARHQALQLAEAEWSVSEALDDHRLPSSTDHPNRRIERTCVSFTITVG